MKLVATVPSCSWEQTYTFTPRIHRYPGAKGVVRKTWWRKAVAKPNKASPKDEKEKIGAPPKVEEKKGALDRKPATAKVPSAPRKPRSQRPQSALVETQLSPPAAKRTASKEKGADDVKGEKPKAEAASGATVPAKPAPRVPAPPATRPPDGAEAGSTTTTTPAARARRLQTNYRPLPPASPPAPAAVRVPTKPKESYKPRVKAAYALPPSFETDRRQLEALLEPTLMVENAHPPATVPFAAASAGGAAHHLPPSRQALLLDPQYKLKTRADFLQRLASEDPYVVTAELREKLRGGGSGAPDAAYCYDYNFNSPHLVDDAWEQRLLAYYRFEDILYDRVVADVLPLEDAMTKAQESVQQQGCSSSGPASRWVAVRDDGHVCSPIELHPVLPAVDGRRAEGYYYYDTIRTGASGDSAAETEYAVLVRPFVDEVAATNAARMEKEKRRVVAKGREWDRQYAIRAAVGATAQEALLDLRVDPRYRRPGEYLLRRNVSASK